MRLILPALALLLLTACGLKDDLYRPDDSPPEPAPETSNADTRETPPEQTRDDATHA